MVVIEMLYDVIDSLRTMPLGRAIAWVTLANVAMFAAALAVGEALLRRFSARRITPRPSPVSRIEFVLAVSCVGLNAAVAAAGVILWREDVIQVRSQGAYGVLTVLLDALVLFIAMDFLMYLFHRGAHHPAAFDLAHRTHHNYESPRPLTLFVLNPAEVVGFGALWLLVLVLHVASIEGILIYLAFNLAFGLVAHLGVEPAPAYWLRIPVLRYVSTATFHAEHHAERSANFGFYLLVWDRLFGTLSPDYLADFTRVTRTSQPAPSPR
jgi:sterol desaturase/sphingolipid hydroxylase (fatty acid hydroxylase superfamily)